MVKTKYEDTIYEKPEYSGKIFMYSSVSWNVLFPIVDVIRSLRKNTIVGHAYGKGQQIIKTYVPQYNHSLLGYDLKNKKDYLINLKAVKNIFIFSDESDFVATNLMNVAKKNGINVICYSNLDTYYHFYNNLVSPPSKFSYKKPEEALEKMYTVLDRETAKKYSDLFDDFEILEPPVDTSKSTLDECIEKLNKVDISEKKKKELVNVKIFDPHLNKLKKMEYERSNKNVVFPDSLEILNQKEQDKRKSLLSRFFK